MANSDGGLMTITPPSGVTGLLIEKFVGSEYLSRLFAFELSLLGPAASPIPFHKMLGQSVTVSIPIANNPPRYFNGIISQFAQGLPVQTPKGDYLRYQATLVPKLWQLTRRKQCFAYANTTIPNLITGQLLGGIYYSSSIQGNFPTLQYCVQYRETNFAFFSRQMEHQGLFYYFVQKNGSHQLVLGNTPSANQNVQAPTSVAFAAAKAGTQSNAGKITAWNFSQRLASGTYTLWDYNFETAQTNLSSGAQQLPDSVKVGKNSLTLNLPFCSGLTAYNYPGFYAWQYDNITSQGGQGPDITSALTAAAKQYATLWMQRSAAASLRIRARSSCPQFQAGCKFSVDSSGGSWQGAYLLTAVKHFADQTAAIRGRTGTLRYANRFACIPVDSSLPFVPPMRTPRPTVKGVQTAVVVGTSGQDITTDPNARVQVQFLWDRNGANTLNAQDGSPPPNLAYWPGPAQGVTPTNSVWIRVAQDWAGRNWGAINIPRMGQEVVVDFLEGDPNQPLIVGSAYNSTNQTPFPLPASGVTSGLKSNSLGQPAMQGSVQANFNGFAFNDTPGQENAQLYAQRLMVLSANKDMVQNVGGNLYQAITGTTMKLNGALPGFGSTGDVSGSTSSSSKSNSWSSWTMDGVTAGVGADIQVIFGEYCKAVLGIYSSVVVGNKVDLIINPFSFVPAALGQFLQPVLSALGGRNEIVLGPKVEFVYNIKSGILMQGEAKVALPMKVPVLPPNADGAATTLYNKQVVQYAAYLVIQKLCLALAIATTLEFVAIASLGPLSTGDWGAAGKVITDILLSVGGVVILGLFVAVYAKILQLIKLESIYGTVAADLAAAAQPVNAYMTAKWTAFTQWCTDNSDGLKALGVVALFFSVAAGIVTAAAVTGSKG